MVKSKKLEINCKTGEEKYIDIDVTSLPPTLPKKLLDLEKIAGILLAKGLINKLDEVKT